VRFRSDNGNIQALNFTGETTAAALAGWSNPSATADTPDFDASTDTFRLTVRSGTLSEEIDILLENVTDSIVLAYFTATRTNRNSNPDAGSVFGLYNNSGMTMTSDNISLTSEPSSAATGSIRAHFDRLESSQPQCGNPSTQPTFQSKHDRGAFLRWAHLRQVVERHLPAFRDPFLFSSGV